MLDVITIISETTPKEWVSQCLKSVEAAAAVAEYDVNYIQVAGVPGHIGRAAYSGLVLGIAPWVCWVDDDDYVLSDAFYCLQEHLDKPVEAIYAREIRLLANGIRMPVKGRHHLTAFRRSFVDTIDVSSYTCAYNEALHKAVTYSIDELAWVYVRRMRVSEAMKLRAKQKSGVR